MGGKKSRKTSAWGTKVWKEKRDEILGTNCETCGSDTSLVLQHTWHPSIPDASFILYDVLKVKTPNFEKTKSKYINKEMLKSQIQRNSCPNCKSINIRQFKDLSWVCNKCGFKFIDPLIIIGFMDSYSGWWTIDPERYISHLISAIKHEHHQKMYNKYEPLIQKIRLLIYIDECIEYITLNKGVKTLCKKCAFKEDKFFAIARLEKNL